MKIVSVDYNSISYTDENGKHHTVRTSFEDWDDMVDFFKALGCEVEECY